MDLCTYFYCLLALHTTQVLAFSPRYKAPVPVEFNPGDTELKIAEGDWKKSFLDLQRTKAVREDSTEVEINEETNTLKARKRQHLKPDSTWWPSKVDYSDAYNEIHKSSTESPQRVTKRPATFEELENRNANIYNPLLNLDHYPIPSKNYTFVELENMNANQYNPYLN